MKETDKGNKGFIQGILLACGYYEKGNNTKDILESAGLLDTNGKLKIEDCVECEADQFDIDNLCEFWPEGYKGGEL